MSVTMLMTSAEMQAEGGRDKWLKLRQNGIGGSDAGVIIGVNNFKNRFQLWLEKTGQGVELERSDEALERMEWGNRLEPVVADWFEAKTGKKLRRCGMIRNDEHPFMFADVDRLVVGENAIVEIKTTAAYNKDEWDGDKVPPSYMAQGLHYMAVGGYDKVYFVCLLGGQQAVIREMERDDEEIGALIEAEQDFWENYVVPKVIPEVDGSDNCKKLLGKLYPGGEKEPMDMDGKWAAVCDNIKEMEEQMKQLQGFIDEKKNKLRLELGNFETGVVGDYKISYGVSTRNTFDAKAFAVDYPDLVKTYTRTGQYRQLRVALTKEAKKRRAKEAEGEEQ